MKKRLLSALLALALVFVLLPTTALAGVTRGSDYDISINGTNYVFSDSETCYFKSSFTTTEPSGSYLKLTKSSDTITVTVSGYVTVSDINVHNNFSTQDKINLIITGNKGSTLNIECKDTYGAALETYQSGDITIKGGITVNANFSADNTDRYTDCYGIRASKNLIITGKGTTVNAVNADDAAAVKVDGNITVSDGAQLKATNKYSKKVTNYTGKAYAIECGGLSISGNNTKVTAKTSKGEKAISGTVYNLTENDDYKLTFKAGMYEGAPSFDYPKPMDKALGYEYVEITQAPTDPYVFIAGEPAIMDQETPIPGGTGTYLYKKTTYNGSFLTLKGVDITGTSSGPAQAIRFGKNGGYYTIELEGENKISGFSSGIVAPSVSGVNNVTVVLSGSGSLDISANQYAIDMQVGNLKFENTGKIMLTTGHNYVKPLNALHVAGNVTIDKTKYDITGEKPVVKPTTEDIGSSPVLETILKGTSTDETLYFKSITITPAAAKPSTIRYDGTTLKQGEIITGENGGTATVDREKNTITLKNFNGTAALSFDATLADSTLVLEGTNTLSSIVTTQKGLTISGSGSLTVGSIRVPNNTQHTANLTINGGAHVTVNRPSSEDEPAVEVSGNLTVTGDGTQLSAECTAATNPAIEVGGNVTISGNPGTNAYTVKAHNKYATQRGRDDNLRPSQMPSAIEISGDSLSISNSARVMAKTDSDGAAVWMPKQKVISVVDASLIAQNSSHNFSTISFGDESNMGNIYAKGQEVNIVAENMLHSSSSLAHRAIKAYIYNHYNTGDSNPYYIKVVSEGVQSGGNVNVIPGHCTSTGGYKVTITRGDAYSAPTTISKIIITGLTPPVKGATPVDKSKVTLTDGLTVESITWGPALTSDGKFAANTAYTAHINYSVKAGYELAAKANCPQVDGANVTRWHQEGMPQDEIEVTFPKTAADTPTEKPTITLDLPAPVAGVAPVTTGVTATSSDNTPLTIDKVEWYAYTVEYNKTDGNFDRIVKGNKVSGNFEANTYYLAEITFDKSISFANGGLNITAPTWPLEGSWPESCIYRVIENSYTARILFPATDAACNHQPGDWQDGTDGEHHVKVCAICHNVVATESHAFGGYQINTNNSHTRVCSVCNAAYTNAHEFNSYAHNENSHWKVCVCGATTSYANHEFDPATGACACGATQSGGNPTPDVPAAPTGLAGVAPTSANSKDGKITGTTAAMEYATEPNGSNWIECGGDEVTGLSAGTYYVRYKRTTDKPASAVATVVVPAYSGGGEIVPPTPDNPGTIVIIRPAEEEKPAQQPNPSTGANDLVGLAVAAAVAAALGSAALLRKHD